MSKRRFWTDDEIDLLREMYPHTPTAAIAKQLGRTIFQIYQKSNLLGLKKSAEFFASPASGRTTGRQGIGTRFVKGQKAWNEGVQGVCGTHENCRETQFKKGHRGGKAKENYKPIGTERLSKDGYLERKMHDGMPLQSRWRAVHIVRWEEINGPLPKGFALLFRDSNKTNTDPGNMELISRADLMRRNTIHRYPPELKKVIRLVGKLKRTIEAVDEKQN